MVRKSERKKATPAAATTSGSASSPEKTTAPKKTPARGRGRKSAAAAVADAIDESAEQQQQQLQLSAEDDEERAALTATTASDSEDDNNATAAAVVATAPVPSTPSKGGRKRGAAAARTPASASTARAPSEEPDEPVRPSRSRRRTVQPRYVELAEDDEDAYEQLLLQQQLRLVAEAEASAAASSAPEEDDVAVDKVVASETVEVVQPSVPAEQPNNDDNDDDVVEILLESESPVVEQVEQLQLHAVEEAQQRERTPTPEPVAIVAEPKKSPRKAKSSPAKRRTKSNKPTTHEADEAVVVDDDEVMTVEIVDEPAAVNVAEESISVVVEDTQEQTTVEPLEISANVDKGSSPVTVEAEPIEVEPVEVIENEPDAIVEEPATIVEEEPTTIVDDEAQLDMSTAQTDDDQVEITMDASEIIIDADDTITIIEEQTSSTSDDITVNEPSTAAPHWRKRGRARATSTSSTTSSSVPASNAEVQFESVALDTADSAEPAAAATELITEAETETTGDHSNDEPTDKRSEHDADAQTNEIVTLEQSETISGETESFADNGTVVDGNPTQIAEPTAVISAPVATKPPKPVQRKRKWLSSHSSTATKSIVAITTDTLNDLIADGRPILLADVRLESSPEPEEQQPVSTNTRKVHDDDQQPSAGDASAPLVDASVADDEAVPHGAKLPFDGQRIVTTTTSSSSVLPAIAAVPPLSGGRKVMLISSSDSGSKSAKEVRPPSPAKFGCSNILYITNLVRPFTVQQLKTLLARTGKLCEDGFWIDKIKSKCYVKYETEDEAVETRHALHGVRWPTANPKCLNVEFGAEETMLHVIETIPSADGIRAAAPASGNVREERVGGGGAWDRFDADEKRDKPTKRPVREWDLGKREDLLTDGRGGEIGAADGNKKTTTTAGEATEEEADAKRSTDRGLGGNRAGRSLSKSPARKINKKENEPPLRLLDDLFRKTKATPCIYWLPLTAEQIGVKEEARRVQMAEHQRKLDEAAEKEKERQREREKERDKGRDKDREKEREKDRGKDRDRDYRERDRRDNRDHRDHHRDRSSKSRARDGDRDRERRRY